MEKIMTLAQLARRGVYFTSISLVLRQFISFVATAYVARLIEPAEFGLFSLILFVVGFAQVLGDIGFTAGLVRSQIRERLAFSTIFWMSVLAGSFLSLVVFCLADLISDFYEMPLLSSFLKMAALGLLVNFLLPVPLGILQLNLAFKEIAVAQAAGSICGAIFVVAGATYGLGIWALVVQPIVGNLVSFALMLRSSRWIPSFEFSFRSVRHILTDGFNLLGSNVALYARGNLDSALIGKFMSTSNLGVYSMTRTLLYAPNYLITSVASRVIFPLLAKIQNDRNGVKALVVSSSNKVALLSLPLYFGLFVTAEDFVFLVFGEKWFQMVDLLRIMVVPAVIQSFGNMGGPILVALGASRTNLYLSVLGGALYLSSILLSIQFGLIGVAVGYSLSNSLIGLTVLFFALKISGVGVYVYWCSLVRPLIASLVMALFLWLVQESLDFIPLVRFVFIVGLGVFVYALLIFLIDRKSIPKLL